METMLQAVVVVFMLFLCSLCLFAVIVIVRDIIYENAKIRREREAERANAEAPVHEPVQVVVQPAPVVVPAPAPVAEPAPVVETKVEEGYLLVRYELVCTAVEHECRCRGQLSVVYLAFA